MEEEFLNINKTFDSPFNQFKHCTVGLNPQIASQMFEQIGSLKHPVVKFSNKNNFKFFNHKYQPITKCYFFGDSNNPNLILSYDFARDLWSRKEVSSNLRFNFRHFILFGRFHTISAFSLTRSPSGWRTEIF